MTAMSLCSAPAVPRRLALCALLAAAAVAGCAPSSSSNQADDFSGTQKDVAETIDDLSSAARSSDEKEICSTLLARDLVRKLDAAQGRCSGAISDQLDTINDADIDIRSIQVSGDTATARVVTEFDGNDRVSTLRLVRDAGRWRVAGLG
jgi:hypothetical protein